MILAYPPAQALPGWIRLAYWPVVFLGLRWLVRYERRHPLPPEQSPNPAPLADEGDEEVDYAEIDEYFTLEEVLR